MRLRNVIEINGPDIFTIRCNAFVGSAAIVAGGRGGNGVCVAVGGAVVGNWPSLVAIGSTSGAQLLMSGARTKAPPTNVN